MSKSHLLEWVLIIWLVERLVKEANVAFALNIHLFSLIRQNSIAITGSSSALSLAKTTPARIPTHNAQGQPLRYYERRQLEQEAKERERKAAAALEPKKTWAETFERFSIFAIAVGMTMGFTKYGWPWVAREVMPRARDYAGDRGWLDHALVSKLLGKDAFVGGYTAHPESAITAASAVVAEGAHDLGETMEHVKSTVTATASDLATEAQATVSSIVNAVEISASSVASAAQEQVEDWTTSAADAADIISSVLNDLTATTASPITESLSSTVTETVHESPETTITETIHESPDTTVTETVQETSEVTVTETIHQEESSPFEVPDEEPLEEIASTASSVHAPTMEEPPVEDFADILTSVLGDDDDDDEGHASSTVDSAGTTLENIPTPTSVQEQVPEPTVSETSQETPPTHGSPVEAAPPEPEPENEMVEDAYEEDVPLETGDVGQDPDDSVFGEDDGPAVPRDEL